MVSSFFFPLSLQEQSWKTLVLGIYNHEVLELWNWISGFILAISRRRPFLHLLTTSWVWVQREKPQGIVYICHFWRIFLKMMSEWKIPSVNGEMTDDSFYILAYSVLDVERQAARTQSPSRTKSDRSGRGLEVILVHLQACFCPLRQQRRAF